MSKSLDRLTLLETFVRIADSGSISAAARDLNLSQPSVSRQLVDLEKRLNCQLIRRNTHSLALTDSGLELLADARQMISGWETLEEKHIASEEEVKGKIKIVAPVALGQSHLARMACEFQRAHPKINISWQLEDANIRFSEVGCDIWIKVGKIPDDTLIVRQLGRVERMLVASPDLIGQRRYHHPKDLTSAPLLALQPFEGQSIPLKGLHNKTYQFSGKGAMSTNNIFALKEATLMGTGLAVLPHWFVEEELTSGALVDLLPEWRAPDLLINVGYLPNIRQPKRMKVFLQVLKQCIENIPGIQSPN